MTSIEGLVPAHALDQIVVGPNPRMRAIFEYVAMIGHGRSTVLITGESGTGKEIVASAIHLHSDRRLQPFVAVSCALFSDALVESELFGHERGAFTGAIAARPGRFERAEGGTLFLDDIDDVPLGMQVKLLRALQNRTIERLGGTRPVPVDVRIIAGTKRDLGRLVAEGRFREDLYYRLNVLPIALPPLRERRDDLPTLINRFLTRDCDRRRIAVPPISDGVWKALLSYDWPGNVRELENTCERIAESCTCGHVRVGCLGASVLFSSAAEDEVPAACADATPEHESGAGSGARDESATITARAVPLDEQLRLFEIDVIRAALLKCAGNKSRAATLLGMKRSTLGDRIARCGLEHRSTGPDHSP